MVANLRRYWRAFSTALRMTARGEAPPPPPREARAMRRHPAWYAWTRETLARVDAVHAAAAASGVDLATRTLTLERREINAATILNTVRFHAEQEYISLMIEEGEFHLMAIQATNLNDHYAVTQLAASGTLPGSVCDAAARLAAHLEGTPLIAPD